MTSRVSPIGASRKGVALLVVLIILLSLVIVTTPFLTSMLLEEETSFVGMRDAYAREHARNAAHWSFLHLLSTHDHIERTARPYGGDSYRYDGRNELRVPLTPADEKKLNMGSARGILWGIETEDEQGKVPLEAVPPHVYDRLLRLAASTGGDPRRWVTRFSVRDVRWWAPARIRLWDPDGDGFLTDLPIFGADKVRIRNPDGAEIRTRLEFRQSPKDKRWYYYPLDQRVGPADNWIVESPQRFGLNVNTAPVEAIQVCLEGLRVVKWGDPPEFSSPIDAAAAAGLAAMIHARAASAPFQDMRDFALWVGGQSLTNEMKQAVLANAANPCSPVLAGSGTLPFVFRSYDTFTVLSSASVNDRAGRERSAHHVRQIVEISPPVPCDVSVQSQWDMLEQYGNSSGGAGVPFGNRIVTFPNPPSKPPDTTLKPNNAYFQLRTARDTRGSVALLEGLSEPFVKRNHYDETIEGKTIDGGDLRFPVGEVTPTSFGPVGYADMAAGGVHFWIRFDGQAPASATLFDLRESEFVNRVTLEIQGEELILSVADETINRNPLGDGVYRVRMPFTPRPDVWYHIGGYFKGSKFGQLLLLRDGFCDRRMRAEHINADGTPIFTRLAADLPAPTPQDPSPTVLLEDDSFLPDGVWPLEIGQEVILYNKRNRKAVRGARNTAAYAHPAGAYVSVFGYSTLLREVWVDPPKLGAGDVPQGYRVRIDRLPQGGTTLALPFDEDTRRILAGSIRPQDRAVPAVTPSFFANPQKALLPQEFATLQRDFPRRGYLKIEDEMIKYDGFTQKKVRIPETDPQAPEFEVPAFKVVERGGLGTAPDNHAQGQQIVLASLAVADASRIPEPWFVQVDDEWFGPVVHDPGDNGLLVPPTTDGRAHRLNRGIGGAPRPHAAGAQVIPIFAVGLGFGNRENLGSGDRVTLTNGAMQRTRARIRRAIGYYEPGAGYQLAALWDFSSVEYVADNQFCRVLKFPSGELIGRAALGTRITEAAMGPFRATLDEIVFFASPKYPEWRLSGSVPENVQSPPVGLQGVGSLRPYGGAVLAGEEILGYAEVDRENSVLNGTVRGYLGSPMKVHDRGDLIFNLSFLDISSLAQDLSAGAGTIGLRQAFAHPLEQYYLLGNGPEYEVVFLPAFMGAGGSTAPRMPNRLRENEGLYRGMFGTSPRRHPQGHLVYLLPYRHFDTFKEGEFDDTMAYWQMSRSIPNAHWKDISWSEEAFEGTRVRAMVRVDGAGGEWFDAPDGMNLFSYTGGGSHPIDVHGSKGDDARIEARFYFEFLPGCFYPADGWKMTPKIREIRIGYERGWRMLHHEEEH